MTQSDIDRAREIACLLTVCDKTVMGKKREFWSGPYSDLVELAKVYLEILAENKRLTADLEEATDHMRSAASLLDPRGRVVNDPANSLKIMRMIREFNSRHDTSIKND